MPVLSQAATTVSHDLSVDDIVAYFLYRDQATGHPDVDPVKLQKLLYYAQGHWLSATLKRLFSEPVEAWEHGPVVNHVYATYARTFNTIVTTSTQAPQLPSLPPDVETFLDRIWERYGEYSTWKLVELTHAEQPWQGNYVRGATHTPIPDQDMIRWFHQGLPVSVDLLHSAMTVATDDDMKIVDEVSDDSVLAMWSRVDA